MVYGSPCWAGRAASACRGIMSAQRSMRATLIGLLIAKAHAHSWLDCLDYDCPDAAPGAGPQAPGACTCKGYARNWANVMAGQAFAADMGRDNRPGAAPTAGGLVCDAGKEPNPGAGTDIPANMYSAQYPAATLASGQAVRSRWPAKNHANTPSAGTVVRRANASTLAFPDTSPTNVRLGLGLRPEPSRSSPGDHP